MTWTREERSVLARLKRPEDVQRFLDELAYNKENGGETCRSPRRVLRDRMAHCLEGALLAASALRFHGRPALVLLMHAERDEDHLLALYREKGDRGAWGAIAKSKFAGLRFRSPVYRTLRELAMSYFEHYCNLRGEKSLREISGAVDLSRFDRRDWERAEDELWDLAHHLNDRRRATLVTPSQTAALRRMDRLSMRAELSTGLLPHPAWLQKG
jgi:hypothetical protein